MADQPNTPSGSRWEPGPGDGPTAETPAGQAADETRTTDPIAPPAYDVQDEATPEDAGADDERRARLRNRAALAGAATALAVGGGVTGFVIGHSTAGDRHDGFVPANFSRQAPGNGQLGEGQQVPPGWNNDGTHDWDHDGDGGPFGQQAPGTNGSSGSSSSDGSGSSANPT